MSEQQQSQLKKLIARGKEQGYLTYAQVNDHLPDDIVDPEQIEEIIGMINDMASRFSSLQPTRNRSCWPPASKRTTTRPRRLRPPWLP